MSPVSEKYVGKPAKRCPRCGSTSFIVNVMGGLVCSSCFPGEAQLRLSAVDDGSGRLRWQEAASDPLTATGGGGGVAGSGESAAVSDMAEDEWAIGVPKTFSDGVEKRVDPHRDLRVASVLVSTSLDWCTCKPGGFWDRDVIVDRMSGEFEQPGVTKKFRRPPSTGSWRPLTQAYFAWLVSRVDEWNRRTGRDAGKKDLVEVADAAVRHGVFGEWALNEQLWPRRPPYGYVGPDAYVDWDIEKVAVPWDDRFEARMRSVQERLESRAIEVGKKSRVGLDGEKTVFTQKEFQQEE